MKLLLYSLCCSS